MKKFIVKAYQDEEKNIRIGLFDKKGNLVEKSKSYYFDETKEQDQLLKEAIKNVTEVLNEKYNGKVVSDFTTPFDLMEKSQEKEFIINNLEVNEEYLENQRKAKLKRNIIGGTALGLTLVLGLTSCSYALGKKNANKKAKQSVLATATPAITASVTPTSTPVSSPAPTPVKTYTDEEKIEFVYDHVEEFQNKYNEIVGREIDSNQALLQLAYINGLSQSQVGFDSNDYILDFLTDYGAYWDAMTTQVKNNIVIIEKYFKLIRIYITQGQEYSDEEKIDLEDLPEGISYEKIDWENVPEEAKEIYEKLRKKLAAIPLKGENPFKNGELYGEYILDVEDKDAYQELASQIENIVTYAYNDEPFKAVESSYEVNKYAAERYVYDNNPDIDFNYQNLSECTKLMNRVMIAHITHFLPEETEFKVDTLVGEQIMINYDMEKEMASFDPNAIGYTVTNNLHYDNDYYYQWLTITETRKTMEDLEQCVLPEETPKIRTRSK